MNYFLSFAESISPDVVGGKGHGLHRLESWGFQVPEGFVVPAGIYRQELAANSIGPTAEQLDGATEEELLRFAADIRSSIRAMIFNPQFSDEIGAIWESISSNGGDQITIACRSSANAEDSAAASFAGQYLTVLGLRSAAQVEIGIKDCWVSMWEDSAVRYGTMGGHVLSNLAMAVVVQRVVPAEVSGVVFSINPIMGNRDEIYINSSWGLGEAVVSGLVTPDTYIVNKDSMSVASKQISPVKQIKFVVGDEGTAHQTEVSAEEAGASTLSDEAAVQVATIARDAEDKAGMPMDLEWAFEGGELYPLQARPITVL
jgi:phosphoenolpyruvate synthase/pyruvate phosphate dikinase